VLIVLCGPGGVGKGTVVRRLLEDEPTLWLSRSWTTRAPRPGEDPDAYVFVDRPTFEAHAADGGFLEWAEFLGNLYGTPVPEVADGTDVLLEIEVQGAAQVLDRFPDALLILLDAPSAAEQEARLRGRGDPDEKVAERMAAADHERAEAHRLGATTVVNGDVDQTVATLRSLIAAARP
jgi:guanylate kinase